MALYPVQKSYEQGHGLELKPVTSPKDYSLRVEQYKDKSDCVLFLVYPLQAVGVYLGCIKRRALSYVTTGGFIIFLIITFKGNMN